MRVKSEDRRKHNRGTLGNRGGRPPKPKTLVIDGVVQDGQYAVVAVTPETVTLRTVAVEDTDYAAAIASSAAEPAEINEE